MANSLYLGNVELARVAQQMTTLPLSGDLLANSVKDAEAALLGFDPARVVTAEPLADNAPLLLAPRLALKSAPQGGAARESQPNIAAAAQLNTGTTAQNSVADQFVTSKTLQTTSDGQTEVKNTPQATLLKILASLGQAVDLSAATLKQAAAQLATSSQEKADRLEALGNDYQAAVTTAQQGADQVKVSAQALQSAHDAVTRAEAELQQNPEDPAASQKLAAAKASFAQAQAHYASDVDAAQLSLAQADALHDEIATDLAALNSPQLSQTAQRHLDAGAQLALVMALLSNAISDSLTLALQAKNEQAQQVQNLRIEKEHAEAEERAKQAKKQEAMSKKVNCAMKILGGLITAVSIVSAAFTGGASMALAVVGLAMMVADTVTKKITGTSLTERVMQPLMEHVLKPLIDALSKLVTGMLEDFGVDKDKAEQAGHIIGAVLGTALMAVAAVAAVVLGKGAAQKILKPMLEMAQKMIGKMLPQVMKSLGSDGAAMVSKSFARMGRSIGNKVPNSMRNGVAKLGGRERIGNHLEQMGNVMMVGKAAADGGTRIAMADMEKKVGQFQALIDLLMAQDLMDQMRESAAIQHLKVLMAILSNLDSEMSSAVSADTNRNKFILSNLSAHAA